MSTTEQAYNAIHNADAFQSLIRLEAIVSFPVPVVVSNQKFLRFFVFDRRTRQTNQKAKTYRPFAQFAIAYPNGEFVEYRDARLEPIGPRDITDDVIGEYPHAAIEQLAYEDLENKRAELFTRYDGVLTLYPRADLSSQEKMAVSKFKGVFEELVEPGLVPFYRALNPGFFQWLEHASA